MRSAPEAGSACSRSESHGSGLAICGIAGLGDGPSLQHPQRGSGRSADGTIPSRSRFHGQFHSGPNGGDYTAIEPVAGGARCVTPTPRPTRFNQFLPVIPHEGAVSAQPGARARVIARGTSKAGRPVNIEVDFEAEGEAGRAIAQSTFHISSTTTGPARRRASVSSMRQPGDGICAIRRRVGRPTDTRESFRAGCGAYHSLSDACPPSLPAGSRELVARPPGSRRRSGRNNHLVKGDGRRGRTSAAISPQRRVRET